MNSNIFETLKKIKDQEKKPAMHIYQDEKTGQIIEEPLSKDMAAGALIHATMKQYKTQQKKFMILYLISDFHYNTLHCLHPSYL